MDQTTGKESRTPDKTMSNWHVWPTHWAGGSRSTQVDGHNTIWVEGDAGEVCRIPTQHGKVTDETYRIAKRIATAS
jgi:hypothetical protein